MKHLAWFCHFENNILSPSFVSNIRPSVLLFHSLSCLRFSSVSEFFHSLTVLSSFKSSSTDAVMTLEHRRSSYDVDQLTTSTKRPTSLRNVRLATGKNQQPSSIYFELSELFNLKLFPPWVGTTLLLKLSPPSKVCLLSTIRNTLHDKGNIHSLLSTNSIGSIVIWTIF